MRLTDVTPENYQDTSTEELNAWLEEYHDKVIHFWKVHNLADVIKFELAVRRAHQ